jgi:predicted phosphate transport protein (TIGR00153 family)
MTGLIARILPREDSFFALFERQAGLLVEAADALAELLEAGTSTRSRERIRQLENAADEVTREVLRGVRRSFITPFDRGAIASLASSLDDAIDEIWHTAKTVGIYRTEAFEPQMRQSAELAAQAARLVAEAMPLMRNVGRNGTRLHDITEAVVNLEGQADVLHDEGISALFAAHGEDAPMRFFVGREIYRYVERVLDRMQDIADEIQGIVIDHA